MRIFFRIALAVLFVNLAVIDLGILRVDRGLRTMRDAGCDEIALEQAIATAPTGFGGDAPAVWLSPASYSVVQFSLSTPHRKTPVTFSLYGCDANGHRYRMWINR